MGLWISITRFKSGAFLMTRLGTGVAAGSAVTVAAGVADAESMASGTPAFFARTGALQEKRSAPVNKAAWVLDIL